MSSPHQHAKTSLARQFFLFGSGSGRPVTEIKTLAKLTGCSECNLARKVPAWTEEREALLIESSTINIDIAPDSLRKHAEDVAFLRERADTLEEEVRTCEDTAETLREALVDAGAGEDLHQILEGYIKSSVNAQKTTAQWLTVQKRWVESSGIEAKLKAFSAGETEKARGRARLEAKGEERGESTPVARGPDMSVFARRSNEGS